MFIRVELLRFYRIEINMQEELSKPWIETQNPTIRKKVSSSSSSFNNVQHYHYYFCVSSVCLRLFQEGGKRNEIKMRGNRFLFLLFDAS